MAQLKSTSINGNLSVTGNFNMNATWSGRISTNSGFSVSLLMRKFGNLVECHVAFATIAGRATLPSWNWVQLCPAGSWPEAFRPKTNLSFGAVLQGIGAGGLQLNTDGSFHLNPYGDFGAPWAGNADICYFI